MVDLICEWGQPRSVVQALEQARATKEIGAGFAKWQIFDPARLASKKAMRYRDEELGGPKRQLATFRLAPVLGEEEWAEIMVGTRALGVEPMATPFDLEAVELLEGLAVSAYKIASGDITYKALIGAIAKTEKRVYLSTGAANDHEIERALGWLDGCDVVLLACDLVYPCPAADAALAQQIPRLRELGGEVGYSDHTREVVTGAVAVALGAVALEKHMTLDPDGEAPDDRMALTVEGATIYHRLAGEAARLCATVTSDPQKPARLGARRSAHAAHDLDADHILKKGDIAWLRPAPRDGIPPTAKLVGRTLAQPVEAGARIQHGDLC